MRVAPQDGVRLPDGSARDEPAHLNVLRAVAPLVSDGELDVVLLTRFDHIPRATHALCHGLLAEYAANARFRSGDCDLRAHVLPRRYRDDVEVFFREHLVVVVIGPRIELVGKRLRRLATHVRRRDYLGSVLVGPRVCVRPTHATCAYNPYAIHLVSHVSLSRDALVHAW